MKGKKILTYNGSLVAVLLLMLLSCSKDDPAEVRDRISVPANTENEMFEFSSTADGKTIPVYVAFPPRTSASGKAVVVLHGSGGPWDDDDTDGDGIADICNVGQLSRQNKEWRDLLLAEGFVVAFPDSYSPRNTCENEGVYKDPPKKFDISGTFVRNHDANGTLELLSKFVWDGSDTHIVDNTKVALVGFSDGGTAIISTLYDETSTPASWFWKQSFSGVTYTNEVKPPPVPKLKFKTAVAYYPGAYHNGYYGDICGTSGIYKSYSDIQFHLAENDPLYDKAACLAETMTNLGGGSAQVYVYENADHSFDGNDEPESTTARNRTLVYLNDKLN